MTPAASSAIALENPQPGSSNSGIGLVSGWSCQGPAIGVSLDGAAPVNVPYGSSRADTAVVCGQGNINTGFGLLLNFNLLGAGTHSAQLFVNGAALRSRDHVHGHGPGGGVPCRRVQAGDGDRLSIAREDDGPGLAAITTKFRNTVGEPVTT